MQVQSRRPNGEEEEEEDQTGKIRKITCTAEIGMNRDEQTGRKGGGEVEREPESICKIVILDVR